MNLIMLAATAAPTVAQYVKTYLRSPVIGGTSVSNIPGLASFGNFLNTLGVGRVTGGIRLECEEYSANYRAEVSEQLLVNADYDPKVSTGGGKSFISDNIAPHPREWTLRGYIPGAQIGDVAEGFVQAIPFISIEQSGLFMPSLKLKTKFLEKIFNDRQLVTFKTRDNELTQVAIVEMILYTRAEVANKVPFSMSLREVNILNDYKSAAQSTFSQPSAGSIDGGAIGAGQGQASSIPYAGGEGGVGSAASFLGSIG